MKRLIFMLISAALVGACAQTPDRYDVPPPRVAVPPAGQPASAAQRAEDEAEASGAAAGQAAGGELQRLSAPPRTPASMQKLDWSGRFPANDSVVVSVESISLRDFINYSFNEVLKASYVIAEGLPGLDDPVTLSLEKPVSSRAYYKLMSELLDSRGIGTTYKDNVFYLHAADGKARGTIPIGFGRRPQDVPDVAGQVMQIIPLRYGMNLSIERTILDLVSVDAKSDSAQSALFVTGERENILRVIDIVGLLDQPANRAREVGIASLDFVGSREAAEQLVTLLENEGIYAGVGRAEGKNVALVPLEQLAALVVFASSPELLQRVQYWLRQLDQPNQGPEERYFIYHPRNARASDLGESLAPLLGGVITPVGESEARDTRSALGGATTTAQRRDRMRSPTNPEETAADSLTTGQYVTRDNVLRRDAPIGSGAPRAMSVQGQGITLSVDPRSNTLIFYTTGQRYQSLLPMIRRLDVPPKQILLEATVAEVTLTGEFAYGVEFAFQDGRLGGGTSGGLGLPDGGFSLSYIDGIANFVRLKLSATDGLVNVLSNPTLVVRDGVEAAISVGNDVPTVGATASDPIISDTQITQVLYRKTGLELRIRPTINAQGLVVMEIEQRISNTQQGASNVEGAPIFFERSVTTEVVARSGQSILLAGLISETGNTNTAKVPGLGDIPGLGWAFRSESRQNEKTELIVLITPRVIDDPSEWAQIRVGMQQAFEHLRLPEPSAVPVALSGEAATGTEICADQDSDGVCDAVDRCARSFAGAMVDSSGCEVGEVILRGVTFGVADAVLTPGDQLLLDSVAEVLAGRPGELVEIRGHTDDTGDAGFNLRLSQQRADSVRSYLISKGIAADRLSALGLGETAPIASNATEEGRAQNRRVTLELRPAARPGVAPAP
jgi:general secretion pathway protein D